MKLSDYMTGAAENVVPADDATETEVFEPRGIPEAEMRSGGGSVVGNHAPHEQQKKTKNLDRRAPKKKNGVSYTFLASIDPSQVWGDLQEKLSKSRPHVGNIEYVVSKPGVPPLLIKRSHCFVREYKHYPQEVCIYNSKKSKTTIKTLPLFLGDLARPAPTL